ncbi:MAG: hypothetical protein QOF83_1428 [Solirubrobacteraceae bacterium]|jgi:hypothetical protein|nr:hypothetical protein [Solirubrobacteraceae bacterium]
MSLPAQKTKLMLVAVSCLALGAGASAIAAAGAVPGRGPASHQRMHPGRPGPALRRLTRNAVHGTVVLATRKGLVTITFDRGRVAAVSGDRLTITEGKARTAPRTVTLTIPPSARVRVKRRMATLSELQTGERVTVIRAPKRTLVIGRPGAGR